MTATIMAADDGVNFSRVGVWFNDPGNWRGENGLLIHIREHIVYTVIAVMIALLIALPLGLLIGHTGRGVLLVAGLANGLRAIPTLGLVVLLVVLISPKIHAVQAIPGLIPRGGLPYVVPVEVVLILLAIPPILTNTYAGVQNVDPAARDAARGMGMREGQIVRKVEFPIALPLIMSGLRSATLQVIATAIVAAYVPFLGGLGRLIVDGTGNLNDPRFGYTAMVCAGIVVAILAVLIDLLLVGVQRLVVSRGVSGRFSTSRPAPSAVTANVPEVATAQT
ncbi:MAG: ABC transporter permease [Actinomycetota bacterium]|nr:ABC transporter permease [Actinomycetota bacterium]